MEMVLVKQHAIFLKHKTKIFLRLPIITQKKPYLCRTVQKFHLIRPCLSFLTSSHSVKTCLPLPTVSHSLKHATLIHFPKLLILADLICSRCHMATLFPYLFFELKCHSQYWPSYIISAILIQTPSFSVTLWFLSSSLIYVCTWNYLICCFLWWFTVGSLYGRGLPCHHCVTSA